MPNRGKNRSSQAKSPEETNNQASSSYGSNAPPQQSIPAALVDLELQRQKKRATRAAQRKVQSEALKNTGNDLFQGGDYEAAVDAYQEAMEEYKATPILFSNLAAAYLKLEQYDEAEDAATEALLLDPKMVKARYRRGLARKEIGNYSAALIDFQIILEQDSTRTEARNQMTETQYLYDKYGDELLEGDSTDGLGYGWPYYDDEPANVSDTESDSSDCHHVGNGIPCRFYNHGGCSRKDTCRYSHAPDDLSERDKLGRNVCLYSLFNSCKFGEAKCVYSHDKTFLPHGWWDHPEHVVLIKERLDTHEVMDQSKDSIEDLLKTYNRLHATAAAGSRSSLSPNISAASSGTRFVLVLALDGGLEEAYKLPTIAALQAEIAVKKALNVGEAITHLASPDLQAVFVADAAIVDHSNAQVLKKLVEFARSGGSVVMGGSFSSFVRFPDFATFFSTSWGLNWKSGSYHSGTFKLNKSHSLAKSNSSLLGSYNMKALHVQGAAPNTILYKEKGVNTTESPAVEVPFGKGHLGYIGDVNWENGSIAVLHAMLHISTSKRSGSIPPLRVHSTGFAMALSSGGTPVTPASSPKRIETFDKKEKGDNEDTETFLETKFVLILALDSDITDSYKQPTINLIKSKSPVKIASNQTEALRLLSSDTVTGVFVADAGITNRKNSQTLTKLVEYAKAGGSVIVGGAFSTFVKPKDMGNFFLKSWGVPWKPGSYHRTTFSLNSAHELAKSNPLLAQSYSMKALHVKDISPDVVVYRPTRESRLESLVFFPDPITNMNESPAVRTRVGKGFLSYIGDVNWEDDSARLLLAMMGLLGPQGNSQVQPKAGPSKAEVSTNTAKAAPSPAPKASPVPQVVPPSEVPVPTREAASAPYISTITAGDEGEFRRLPVGPTRRPFLMILSFGNEKFFSGVQGDLLELLRRKLEVLHGLSHERVLELLGSQDLVGILITDAAIVNTENAYLLSRLVAFTKAGGTVVLGGSFSAHVKFNQLGTFFQDSWGLPWQSGDYTRLEITLNNKHELAQSPVLRAGFVMKGLFVSGVTPQTALYVPARAYAAKKPPQSPVASARIGNGRLGYIGDVGLQDEHSKIVLAMFGLSQ